MSKPETITLDRETFEAAMLRLITRKNSRDHATAILRLTTRNSFSRDHATAALFRAAILPDPPDDAFARAVSHYNAAYRHGPFVFNFIKLMKSEGYDFREDGRWVKEGEEDDG